MRTSKRSRHKPARRQTPVAHGLREGLRVVSIMDACGRRLVCAAAIFVMALFQGCVVNPVPTPDQAGGAPADDNPTLASSSGGSGEGGSSSGAASSGGGATDGSSDGGRRGFGDAGAQPSSDAGKRNANDDAESVDDGATAVPDAVTPDSDDGTLDAT